MNRFLCVTALVIIYYAALTGQAEAEPAKWIGTWVLNISESRFGPFLMPGAPSDFAILNQTLKLEKSATTIRLSGETVFRDSSGEHPGHDDTRLGLDGAETIFGPVSLSVRLVDSSSFEVISKLKNSNPNLSQVSYFSVSSDGMKLTETKTQTEREVPKDGSKTGAVIRVVKSVLVFAKQPEA